MSLLLIVIGACLMFYSNAIIDSIKTAKTAKESLINAAIVIITELGGRLIITIGSVYYIINLIW